MTGPDRDLQPPEPARPGPDRAVELVIGWDLEHLYQHYAGTLTFLTRGIHSHQVDELAEKGRRLTNHLADLGMRPDRLEVLNLAIRRLTRKGDHRLADLDKWMAGQQDVAQRLDAFIGDVRALLPRIRRRYYDLGVMLNQLAYYAAMIRNSTLNPGTFIELPGAVLDRHRAELLRVAGVLIMFTVDASGDRAPDPEHAALDEHLLRFALWLADWRRRATDPDEPFFDRLADLTQHVGRYRVTGRYMYEVELPRRGAPTATAEPPATPLGVPRPDTRVQALLTAWHAVRRYMADDLHAAVDKVVGLLDRSRYVVGPAHPVTLEIQVDLAYAYAAAGHRHQAVAMCWDALATAEHYYRRGHATTYKILAETYGFLRFADPDAARTLYDDGLRRLVEMPRESVPPDLRDVRAYIVERIGHGGNPGRSGRLP
ncbi:hypothetical protein GCM10010492_53690 [Saccharothrix mutabilis subsp. mutabilis]|uniref:Tetratricopeptide repeat protein n=1 Tax=Saccharothrix mutabilis subsp. mutabilis TaxID=66855 RepID=A0ABN0UDV8_9PSEU